jgi:Flp pilus assembly pilin Flp
MLNIVEKYSTDTSVESEEGVVAIEYVVVAAAIVAALVGLWSAFGETLATALDGVIDDIGGA